ncbi:aspartate aminotransferase family protein [Helicobacter sp. faydin-H20]|uniref:aspartate aminotransferase family protein n=1 Tax=Helicobacter anatolicus TaxID=2905874 RepID=UPI001E495026|nr:aspartate aminotransferase family protein [Helicobacter anatolicus]MCE3036747.1 aspartate aminotransferase family protein [Helicobacter anatolicus]
MQLEELMELDKKYILPTYNRGLVDFSYGKGARLFSACGKDYIDFGSGIGVCSVGHSNEKLNNAIKDQVDKLIHVSNLYLNALQAKLAEKIVQLSGLDARVFFGNSGAEANECAIKIARKFGEKDGKMDRYKIITLESSFHGRTLATLRATGQEKFHKHFAPFPEGFEVAKDLYDVYSLIDDKTCAVMLELIQGEGGVYAFDKKQVQELAKYLKENHILLIVDEVQTGIFRMGEMLASQVYEIEPEIITLAKGLAGGIPIGAVLTTLKDVFEVGDHGSTFGGNLLSCRAGLEVLEILESYKNHQFLEKNIQQLDSYLFAMLEDYADLFNEITGLGMMRGLRAKSIEIQTDILQNAFLEGVIVLRSGRNVVRFLPPLTITKEEMQLGFERLKKACQKVREKYKNIK